MALVELRMSMGGSPVPENNEIYINIWFVMFHVHFEYSYNDIEKFHCLLDVNKPTNQRVGRPIRHVWHYQLPSQFNDK